MFNTSLQVYRATASVSRMSKPHRSGFTLVELLVVIAIISILVSMMLPAVNAARESARRVQCVNHVLQIGLAMQNYEMGMEALPSGVLDVDGPVQATESGQHISWTVQLLPYLEHNPLFEMIDMRADAYAEKNAVARRHQLDIFQCPSAFRLNPTATSEHGILGTVDYAGCHHDVEAPIDADNHGLLYRNSRVRYVDIWDGSSKTILVGEKLTIAGDLGWVSGTKATLRNTGTMEQFSPVAPSPHPDTEDPFHVGGFGSGHPGGANFVFADGSVKFLVTEIEPNVFNQLGHRADGQLLSAEMY